MSDRYDLTIDTGGVNIGARIKRGAETPYRERFIRAEVTQNLLSQASNLGQVSRPDQAQLYQTDWSGGSAWWKPLIADEQRNTYFTATNFDVFTQPGKVVPGNKPTTVTNTSNTLWHAGTLMVDTGDDIFVISDTNVDTAAHRDVAIWTPGSNTFVRDPNYNSGSNLSGNAPLAICFDSSDGYAYVLNTDGEITRFNPVTEAENGGWITSLSLTAGANIFVHNGNLMFYSGDQVFTVNKSSPSATSVFNDGQGPDILNEIGNVIGYPANTLLAIATPEGIYYVKNVAGNAAIVPWIYRVDRDEAGNWIGNPIGTLPSNALALNIGYHLGSIIIIAAADAAEAGNSGYEVIIYHITQGSMGVIGSPLGTSTTISEEPVTILGSRGNLLFIGSGTTGSPSGRVWVYDAISGGLHPFYSMDTSQSNPISRMASVTDSTGAACLLFLSAGDGALFRVERNTNPDTVSAFGDDETHYTLESNYFDMGLPMEDKEISKVAVIVDAASTASAREWTVQLSTDDGAFADVLTHSGTAQYAEAAVTGGTHRGKLFRYKLIYQTKNAQKRALRAVLVTANSGQMIREWEIVLDGNSLMNVENETVAPSTFMSNMRTIAVKEQAINVAFNYQDQDLTTSLAETVAVKVMSCEMIKHSSDEATITLVIRET